MMKMTERLKAEHGVLLVLLDHLADLLHRRPERAALRATVDAIAAAEEEHALVEERLLFRMLDQALGPEYPALVSLQAEHRQIERLAQQVRVGAFSEDTVRDYVRSLRSHLERETHQFFPLVDELVPEERLAALSNWDEEHVLRVARWGTQSSENWLG